MKPTSIKISISQDGLLPQQSIHLGETMLQSFPKKLMSALDFEKIDSDKKRTTFIGIMPIFVVIGEKTQEIEIEVTIAHPELREKVVDIFTQKPSGEINTKPAVAKPKKPASKKTSPKKTEVPAKSASPEKKPPATKKSSAMPVSKSATKKSATSKTASATVRKTNRKVAGKK